MLSPDPYYPEDDFDVDYGLDLDQFEYDRTQQPRNQEPYEHFEHEPYDDYGTRREHYSEGYYDHEPPAIMEYGDNIVMKARPEYEEIPGRPFEPREYYGEGRYDDIDRRPVRHSQPRYYHEPRMQEDPYYSGRDQDAYSRSYHHDTYSSRDRHDTHSRRAQRDFYSTARYRKPSSNFEEDEHPSNRSHRSRSRAASPTKPSGSMRHSRGSNKKEKIRKFPPPDSKLPAIPPPDYDGADVGVKYVPQPDY